MWSFDIDCERGVFDLYSVDMVDFARAAECIGGDFTETEILDLPFSIVSSVITQLTRKRNTLLQFHHSLNSLLNWRLPIHSMAVIEIDSLDT